MEDGRPALAHFFDGADGHPLAWQVDVAWLARGGANPSEWLAKEKARVISAHVKDIAPAGQKTDEDLKAIFAYLRTLPAIRNAVLAGLTPAAAPR